MALANLFPLYLAIIAALIIYLVAGRLSRFHRRTVLDVQKFLRGGDPKGLLQMMNPQFEDTMRSVLPRRRFLRQQRKSLHYALEFLLCWAHDAYVCLEWANYEIDRETIERPGEPDADLFIERAARLQRAAIESRVYALVSMLRVRYWMIVRTQWWLPFPAPRICDLKEIRGLTFVATHNKFVDAVSGLSLLHGSEFQESFLRALIKTDLLDESLGR